MKYVITILVLLTCLCAKSQTTYYVDTTGSDGNAGTSISFPWKTISKVNSMTFTAGSQILFKRGQTWHEALVPPSSGSPGNNIVFGAYGSGARPVITGFVTLSGWTNPSGNLWEANVSSGTRLNEVTVNGNFVARGRWPNYKPTTNKGYATYDNGGNVTTLTDDSIVIKSGVSNWASNGTAEVRVRTEPWEIDHSIISSQSGTTINFSPNLSQSTRAGNGYFIQNDIRTVDTLNEWYYTPTGTTKLTMYSTVGNPGSTVRASTIDDIITISGKSYITIRDLKIEGADRIGIYLTSNSSNVIIRNCEVDFCGENGIANWANFSWSNVSDITVDSSKINHCNSNGIYINWFPASTATRIWVNNDTVTNCGFLPGIGAWSGDSYDGIYVKADTFNIKLNVVDSVGSSGISALGRYGYVDSNYVQHGNLWCEDIGLMYSSHRNDDGRNIWDGPGEIGFRYNIVGNGGDPTAGLADASGHVRLSYQDETFDHGTMIGNTFFNSIDVGLMWHRTNYMTARGNTVYNNRHAQLSMLVPDANNETFTGQRITNNIFFSKTAYQYMATFRDRPDSVPYWQANGGLIDSNYYFNPYRFPVWSHHVESLSNTRFWNFTSWRARYPTVDAHTIEGTYKLQPYTGVTAGSNQATSTGFGPNANYNNAIGIGAVTAGTVYRVILTASASAIHSLMDCIMVDFAPNQEISEHQFVKMQTSAITDTFYLVSNRTTSNAVIYMYLPDPITHTVSGVTVKPLTAYTPSSVDDSIYFNYNATKVPVSINLPGVRYWKDVRGNRYADTVTIQPYQSVILMIDTGAFVSNLLPTANAGTDITIQLPTSSTTLNGSASSDPDGTITAYAWVKLTGTGGTIVSPTSASSSLTGLSAGTYTYKLTVTDNLGATDDDTVMVTVLPANIPPTAAAGADQSITLPTSSVTVNGSGSFDTDGTISTYAWTKISGPSTFTITSPASVSTTITGLVAGTYVFRLTVTDNQGATGTDDIQVTVSPGNISPVANAGGDAVIVLPTSTYQLDGSASYDPDGSITTYAWSKLSGPAYSINNAGIVNPMLSTLTAGVYVFRLMVTDNNGATNTDNITITVGAASLTTFPVQGRHIKIVDK